MKGDIIVVEDHHRAAGRAIADRIASEITRRERPTTVTVAGESGSGKSETATAIAEALAERSIAAVVLQQDDYFIHPPRTNDRTRRANICWVGPTEVQLDLLDDHLAAVRAGASELVKPLVIYEEDRVVEETVDIGDADVVIAEGTYTSLLEHVDTRVFIARNRLETMEHRQKRGREQFDPFIEEVLKIEHGIISQHIERADVVISRDYEVSFVE